MLKRAVSAARVASLVKGNDWHRKNGGRSGEIGKLEDAGWSSEGWEHNACVQPTSSAVLAGAGKQGDV
jgi:hypothetical protein